MNSYRVLWAMPSMKPISRNRQGFVARWFTPSDSDQQSGAQYNEQLNASQPPATAAAPTDAASKKTAAEEIARLRRMRAMAGGKTLLTSEGMGSGTGGKTLLGS